MTDPRLRVVRRIPGASDEEVTRALARRVRVELPSGVPLWRHQVLALALIDMLGRLFSNIDIVCDPSAPADPRLPPGPPLLLRRLQVVGAHGLVRRRRGSGPAPGNALVVRVGGGAAPADIYVDGREWVAYVGTRPSELPGDPGGAVAVGPLAAACRAASQVFQRTLGDLLVRRTVVESSYWSGLTYEVGERPFDDPDFPVPTDLHAVAAGAGSVGGAAVYLFAHTPDLAGELDLVDPQNLEARNPDRALLVTSNAARAQLPKVRLAARRLRHLPLDVRAHQATLAQFVASRPRGEVLPLVLSAVDSIAARREIQDCLPLEVINAACRAEEIAVSAHVTGDGPCLYCLYLPQVLDSNRILVKLIAAATGAPVPAVIQLMLRRAGLTDENLRAIEEYRKVPAGSLQDYAGKQIDELYRAGLRYAEVPVSTASGAEVAVAAVFVTALAGFILAGEALKASVDSYTPYRLGVRGKLPGQYEESLFASPDSRLLVPILRHPGTECLCRSPRRMRLLRKRYGTAAAS